MLLEDQLHSVMQRRVAKEKQLVSSFSYQVILQRANDEAHFTPNQI
jgi:outer membrane lipopolysaccharide assembly protein LptE/RlpB